MTKLIAEVWACSDCAMIIANDDDTGMTEERAEEVREGIAAFRKRRETLVVDSDLYEDFSTVGCYVCGTGLAGARFVVSILR